MKKSTIVSLFFLPFSILTTPCPNDFRLTLSEDKKAYHRRQFHIFYDKSLKSIAEILKCHVAGTVKQVDLIEISEGQKLDEICELKAYSGKLADKLRQKDYMVTVTKQKKYTAPSSCEAINQFNLMKTPSNKWAVQIRGHVTDLVMPIHSKNGDFHRESLRFALDALFFATSYGFGDSTFKSLDGEIGFKGSVVLVTAVVYLLVAVVAVIALITLFVLFIIKRRRDVSKRESEKSKLLRNSANNNCDDSPVEVVFD